MSRCLITTPEDTFRAWGVVEEAPLILKLGTRWSFTHSLLSRKRTRYTRGWQSPGTRLDTIERKNLLAMLAIKTPIPRSSSPQLLAVPTDVYFVPQIVTFSVQLWGPLQSASEEVSVRYDLLVNSTFFGIPECDSVNWRLALTTTEVANFKFRHPRCVCNNKLRVM